MLYDTITNYGIAIKDNEIYLIKNGKQVKLVDTKKILSKSFNKYD